MKSPPDASPAEHLPLLTEARGIAALLVVHDHLLLWHLPLLRASSPFTMGIVRYGWLSVDFFFVLSGFVLAHVYRAAFTSSNGWSRYLPFLRARFARIYPLHFVTSTGFLMLSAYFSGAWQWRLYLHDLFLINALPKIWPLNVPSWSIGAEAVTYLFAPVMIALAGRLSPAALLAGVASCGACLSYFTIQRWGSHDYHSFFRCLPEFLSGVLLYQFHQRYPFRKGIAAIVVVAALLMLALGLAGPIPSTGKTLACLVPIALLVLALPRLADSAVRLFSQRPLRFLGDISYSVYLVHPLVLLFVPAVKATLVGGGLGERSTECLLYFAVLPAVLACSGLTYRFIELPGRRWLRPAATAKARSTAKF